MEVPGKVMEASGKVMEASGQVIFSLLSIHHFSPDFFFRFFSDFFSIFFQNFFQNFVWFFVRFYVQSSLLIKEKMKSKRNWPWRTILTIIKSSWIFHFDCLASFLTAFVFLSCFPSLHHLTWSSLCIPHQVVLPCNICRHIYVVIR